MIMLKYILMTKPLWEALPVVATYQKYEIYIGIVHAQRLQRVPGVRRTRKVELIVGGHQMPAPARCCPYHLQADVVSE